MTKQVHHDVSANPAISWICSPGLLLRHTESGMGDNEINHGVEGGKVALFGTEAQIQ